MALLPGTTSAPRRVLALLVLMTLMLGGCVADYPQTIFDSKSEFNDELLNLFILILWPAAIVFVLVEGWLVYTIWRYRRRPDHKRPEQVHGNTKVEIAWTIAPALVLAIIAVPTVRTIFVTQAPVAEGALKIRVIAHQFWWEYEYPELGIVAANEFWAPIGQTVGFEMVSVDVIHSFWVPAMGGKRDVVPNHINHLWFTPREEGVYLGQCGEYCGDSHANMRLRMIAVSPERFQQWVAQQKANAIAPPAVSEPTAAPTLAAGATPGPTPVPDPAVVHAASVARGATLVAPCMGCHTIQGNPMNGNQRIGPNLTHLASRTTFGAGIFELSEENKDELVRWIRNAPGMKPGVKMPAFRNINEKDAEAIADYLLTLH